MNKKLLRDKEEKKLQEKERINKEEFSKRLKSLYEITGKTQKELYVDLGVRRATVSRWENGHNVPTLETIKRIADYFGVRYKWLIGEDEEMMFGDVTIDYLRPYWRKQRSYLEPLGYKFEEICDKNNIEYGYTITKGKLTRDVSMEALCMLIDDIDNYIEFRMTQLLQK